MGVLAKGGEKKRGGHVTPLLHTHISTHTHTCVYIYTRTLFIYFSHLLFCFLAVIVIATFMDKGQSQVLSTCTDAGWHKSTNPILELLLVLPEAGICHIV